MKTSEPLRLDYPFSAEAVNSLRVGDRVSLNGLIFTGRDRLHRHLAEGAACPVDLRDGAIYHCGPVVVKNHRGGWTIPAAGPTTSAREEPFMGAIVERFGLRVILGKGGMGAGTAAACRRFGAVYVQAVGGAAALLARRIRAVRDVYFLEEFGAAEALWVLEVEDFEGVVAMDAHGGNLYDRVCRDSSARLRRLLDAPGSPPPGGAPDQKPVFPGA